MNERLVVLRKKYGLTQKQLSELIGCPKRTLEEWEGERRECKKYILDLIIFKVESVLNDT